MILNLTVLPIYFIVVGAFAYPATVLFGVPAFFVDQARMAPDLGK
jgi:hypothetical protein